MNPETRYIPPDYSLLLSSPCCTIYVKDFHLLGFRGKSLHATLHQRCQSSSETQLAATIYASECQKLSDIREVNRKSRLEHRKSALSAIPINAILVSSWGYDQTNIDFYRVTAKTQFTLTIVPICSRIVSQTSYDFQVVPDLDTPSGSPRTIRSLSISSFEYLRVWSGSPMSCSDTH